MAIRVIKEVNRDAGRKVVTGKTILAGQPLELAANDTVQPYSDVTGATAPVGLASDSNAMFPLQAANGLTAGAGYDYTNFNRGGLVGCFVNGGEFTLTSDDGVNYPYDQTLNYALNTKVYANGTTGQITHLDTNGYWIGTVMGYTGSSPLITSLTIKLVNC